MPEGQLAFSAHLMAGVKCWPSTEKWPLVDLDEVTAARRELGISAYDAYILEAARSSGFPLLALDRPIRRNAEKLGLSLVELDL